MSVIPVRDDQGADGQTGFSRLIPSNQGFQLKILQIVYPARRSDHNTRVSFRFYWVKGSPRARSCYRANGCCYHSSPFDLIILPGVTVMIVYDFRK